MGQLRERWVDGDLLVGSNIRTLGRLDDWVRDDGTVEDGWIPHYPLLEEWVQQDGDPVENPQQPTLFIGDEFSSNASGTGEDGHKVRQKMGSLVYKIRKYGGALIYIAHGESSIHPMLWRVPTIIEKKSKKRAVVADRVSGGKPLDVDRARSRGQRSQAAVPTKWPRSRFSATVIVHPRHGQCPFGVVEFQYRYKGVVCATLLYNRLQPLP